MVAVLARYASRFSVRALDLTVDSSMLWVGGGLALWPRRCWRLFRACRSGEARRDSAWRAERAESPAGRTALRVFAVIQIAASFVLLAAAGGAMKTLLSLELAQSGFDTHHVLAVNVPVMAYGKRPTRSWISTRKRRA